MNKSTHNCGMNDGDCGNRCGELPITPDNIVGYMEYLDFNDGSPSGGKMYNALEVVLAMCKRDGYTTWDKSMVPLVDGKYDEEATKKWELAHGHDIRLKCYPEFGCQLWIDPEELLFAMVEKLK